MSRFATWLDTSHLTKKRPEKKLRWIAKKQSGRNAVGVVTVRHQGAGEKRFFRQIDFKREKTDMKARVLAIEYDPNRTADIALVLYEDGEKRYVLAPEGLTVGTILVAGETAPITAGNVLPLSAIPVGTLVHNIEIIPGKGGQMARGAGSAATVQGFEEAFALVKLPSGEIRRLPLNARATIGQVGNSEWKNINLGTAGRARRMGIRPTVRGTAQNPRSHSHGGGEGRTGEGMHPKTPWGKPARGKKTRNRKKFSNKYIVARRK